jgi:hypothetical protein
MGLAALCRRLARVRVGQCHGSACDLERCFIRAIRERVGSHGFSAYVDAAVERQIERDLLEEALLANEAEAGSIPQEFKDEAAALFRDDAVVAATALRSVGPVVISTSDADNMEKLCGKQVRIVTV